MDLRPAPTATLCPQSETLCLEFPNNQIRVHFATSVYLKNPNPISSKNIPADHTWISKILVTIEDFQHEKKRGRERGRKEIAHEIQITIIKQSESESCNFQKIYISRCRYQRINLLEVGELCDLHAIHLDFAAQTPCTKKL